MFPVDRPDRAQSGLRKTSGVDQLTDAETDRSVEHCTRSQLLRIVIIMSFCVPTGFCEWCFS